MKKTEQTRFDTFYERHLMALKLPGLSDKTIAAYSRAERRVAHYYDRCPDQHAVERLEVYFADLADSHWWSTVKVDRNALRFF